MWTIRRATRDDREGILALWEQAGLPLAAPAEWDALCDGRTSAILVAEEAKGVVGAAVATYDGWRAYLYHVAVHPEHRRRGIGHDLVGAAEQYLAEAGAQLAYVMVSEWNTHGLALIGSAGFLPEGDIVLAKRLPFASRGDDEMAMETVSLVRET